jgi:hypothetical protein
MFYIRLYIWSLMNWRLNQCIYFCHGFHRLPRICTKKSVIICEIRGKNLLFKRYPVVYQFESIFFSHRSADYSLITNRALICESAAKKHLIAANLPKYQDDSN